MSRRPTISEQIEWCQEYLDACTKAVIEASNLGLKVKQNQWHERMQHIQQTLKDHTFYRADRDAS
jgi:hypothetical protein